MPPHLSPSAFRRLDVAVIGAGVAGLAAALLLARAGHRVTVLERFASARPIGSGLMMQPTGLAALERLGLRAALERLGHRIDRIHGLTARGRVIFDLPYDALAGGHRALAVHRGALHGVLWSGFERSGARLVTGCTVADIALLADGRAAPIDESGRRHGAADLVIDASGARSPLRRLVTPRAPRPFAYGAVWATVPDIGIAPNALAQRYIAAHTMVGYLPLGGIVANGPPLAAFFWSLKPDTHDAWRAGFARWRGAVEQLWPALGPVLASLEGPDALTLASYAHFTAPVLSRGPLVLIGDAAHTTSPQLGQGANQGLIDAVILADALTQAPDRAAALALYARTRRAHVRFYQYASWAMTRFFQSDSAVLPALRDLAFDPMRRIPYLRREMVRTLAGLKTGLFAARAPETLVNALGGEADAAALLADRAGS